MINFIPIILLIIPFAIGFCMAYLAPKYSAGLNTKLSNGVSNKYIKYAASKRKFVKFAVRPILWLITQGYKLIGKIKGVFYKNALELVYAIYYSCLLIVAAFYTVCIAIGLAIGLVIVALWIIGAIVGISILLWFLSQSDPDTLTGGGGGGRSGGGPDKRLSLAKTFVNNARELRGFNRDLIFTADNGTKLKREGDYFVEYKGILSGSTGRRFKVENDKLIEEKHDGMFYIPTGKELKIEENELVENKGVLNTPTGRKFKVEDGRLNEERDDLFSSIPTGRGYRSEGQNNK